MQPREQTHNSLPVGSLQCIQMPAFRWHDIIYFKYVNNIRSQCHNCHVWPSNDKQLGNFLYPAHKDYQKIDTPVSNPQRKTKITKQIRHPFQTEKKKRREKQYPFWSLFDTSMIFFVFSKYPTECWNVMEHNQPQTKNLLKIFGLVETSGQYVLTFLPQRYHRCPSPSN